MLAFYQSRSTHLQPLSQSKLPFMEVVDTVRLLSAALEFPTLPGKKFSYGTAGFRSDASQLTSTVFRCGVLAALRSLSTGATTGVMVTASHNPISDNGVKLVDPGGGMLVQDWEPLADALVNAEGSEMLVQVVEDIVKNKDICRGGSSGQVLLARDTRPSGERLLGAARQGIEAVGVVAISVGILTTPQLHWMVRMMNKGSAFEESQYYAQLSNGFRQLAQLKPSLSDECMSHTYHEGLIVDGANGVGAIKLIHLQKAIGDLNLEIRNCGEDGLLNDHVGADFVQKEKMCPRGFDSIRDLEKRCVSLDGDADRLVYFYFKDVDVREAQSIQLLDGDKIMTLFALFITEQLEDLCQGITSMADEGKQAEACCNRYLIERYGAVKFGVVQTAYANGASTKFLIENLGLKVVFTPTGVKYLHEKALEYDIGIYFEANGHGTILMNEEFLLWLRGQYIADKDGEAVSQEKGLEKVKWQAAQRLLAVSEVVNQAVGDALSGLLLVEMILQYMNWSIRDWNAIYRDVPSRQLKLQVLDREAVKTADAEKKVVIPTGLQDAIDAEVGKFQGARAFVRPSGTEDVVRIYAEAASQDEADTLAHAVAAHVYQLAGGVGKLP